MLILTEQEAAGLVTRADALASVKRALMALHRGDGELFPVVQGRGEADLRVGVKGGRASDAGLVGLKVGSYAPSARAQGRASHGSTTLLLDACTGEAAALVASAHLTALRTAAIDALAVDRLARADASVLAIVGAGRQAWYDLRAIADLRSLGDVRVWSRDAEAARALADRARRKLGVGAACPTVEAALEGADIVVTATAARTPLVMRRHVAAGAHVSAMGADAPGKQELELELVAQARLFADVVGQSLTLGEFEAGALAGRIGASDVTPLAAVLEDPARGRRGPEEITVFDSSGFALQDLEIASVAVDAAVRAGRGRTIDLALSLRPDDPGFDLGSGGGRA